MKPKVIYASDYRGIDLREDLVKRGYNSGFEIIDLGIPKGSPLDYIDISMQLAEELRTKPEAFGVITCGSGQGAVIALNRYAHIRACACRTVDDAIQIRKKQNANVICFGSKHNTPEESAEMIEAFLNTPFVDEKYFACVKKLGSSSTNHVNEGVNLIVRAIIIHKDHILLSTPTESNRSFAKDLYFLPGGHVDYNEPGEVAIKRELLEEMNLHGESTALKGILECSWDRKGRIYHELNLVFQVEIENLRLDNPPTALDHGFQKFIWLPLEKLQEITILPEQLKPIILRAVQNKEALPFYSKMMKETDN